jgi:UDP-N-acetyl-D-glucosamine/UDP-N-acetyl-D-galactosamine dehydrogenase
MNTDLKNAIVCVIGLGYVGLPLIVAFGRSLKVTGLDIDPERVAELQQSALAHNPNISFTTDATAIRQASYIIMCVPTPVTEFKEPDLSPVVATARTISLYLQKGTTVILESTVYPGVTEDIVVPVLEESGLKCGFDFKVGYSPERINPGDEAHSVEKVTKVVAGMDEATTEQMAALYGLVTPNIFKARSIMTAEAAKAIENTQRDLNIALMNELAMLFARMGLDTRDVLDTAATKWNFNRYFPGLVGGHCIPVDPYYLVYKARELDFHPRVITAGRAVNDGMPKYVAEITVKALNNIGKVIKGSKVLIMGLTYKENVPDTRESPARGIIKELREYGVEVYGYDPLLKKAELAKSFDLIPIDDLSDPGGIMMEAVIITVVHDAFRGLTLGELKSLQNTHPLLIDVRRLFNADDAVKAGFVYRTL